MAAEAAEDEMAQAETMGLEMLEVETMGLEMVEAEMVGLEMVEAEMVGLEMVEAETMGLEMVEAETMGLEMMEAETMGLEMMETAEEPEKYVVGTAVGAEMSRVGWLAPLSVSLSLCQFSLPISLAAPRHYTVSMDLVTKLVKNLHELFCLVLCLLSKPLLVMFQLQRS